MAKPELYAVVMAGGRGERFWPQSRQNCSKLLLHLIGNLTLIEQTTSRMLTVVPPEHCLIVTNGDYVQPMRSLLPMVPPENIIGEITGRDTGGCLALADGLLSARGVSPDAVVIATPADHSIENLPGLSRTLLAAAEAAAGSDRLLAIGVPPADPATGYGYIHLGKADREINGVHFHSGDAFREKPSAAEAAAMFASGEWCWNSGIFLWRRRVFQQELQRCAPAFAEISAKAAKLRNETELQEFLKTDFNAVPATSIDYVLMEKQPEIMVAECGFDWLDVGSWSALRKQIRPEADNNVVRGLFAGLDAHDCIVVGDPGHLIAAVDVKDLVIVTHDDATLVCPVQSAQRIKDLVHKMAADPALRKFL